MLATSECVHCGFCLPACPTYPVLGTEMDNPRGRLELMAALESGRLKPVRSVVRHLDLCLGCRACETACPSGVPYGRKLEQAREHLHGTGARPLGQRLVQGAVLALAAAPPGLQGFAFGLLRRSGLARLAAGSLGARLLPSGLALGARMLCVAGKAPVAAPGPASAPAPAGTPASPRAGVVHRRVGLLPGCIGRWMQPQVHAASTAVLERAGCAVVAPAGQRCCGALHAHAGDLARARALARATIASFEREGELEAIVVDAAGCGAAMKDYGTWLASDPAWAERAARFSARVRDVLEWLAAIGPPPMTRSVDARVACQDACHVAHAQRLPRLPESLLASVPGLTLVPVEESDRCCGSAGLYNLLHSRVASSLLDAKLARWQQGGAQLVAAGNTGCLMHIAAGAAARGVSLQAVHPVELIEAASR